MNITITVNYKDDETPLTAEVNTFAEAILNLGAMEEYIRRGGYELEEVDF